jgi:hypothetical protein
VFCTGTVDYTDTVFCTVVHRRAAHCRSQGTGLQPEYFGVVFAGLPERIT